MHMSDQPPSNPSGETGGSSFYQNFQHTPVGARVPEKIGRGVFATAVMVLQTNELFVVDFLSMGSQPQQVVSRIVMTATNFSQFLAALRHNVTRYESEIGPLKPRWTPPTASGQPAAPGGSALPAQGAGAGAAESASAVPPQSGHETVHDTLTKQPSPPPPQPAHITDVYEQLKFPEDLLCGAFANAVMVRHTPEEFCFDFISNLYPRPVVVSRVYAAAGRVPSFIEAMSGSFGRYERGGQ
jgi:hypothetical protein